MGRMVHGTHVRTATDEQDVENSRARSRKKARPPSFLVVQLFVVERQICTNANIARVRRIFVPNQNKVVVSHIEGWVGRMRYVQYNSESRMQCGGSCSESWLTCKRMVAEDSEGWGGGRGAYRTELIR